MEPLGPVTGAHEADAVKIVIVDQERLMCDLLTRVLNDVGGLEVVATARDGDAALRAIDAHDPDVVLMDLSLGTGPDGVTIGRQARKSHPNIGIVVLTGRPNLAAAREIILGEGTGWSYLLKRSVESVDGLARAIRGAASGMTVIDPQVVTSLRPGADSVLSLLTRKQLRVLELVARGLSNESVANHLGLSTRTVEHHLNEIYQHFQGTRKPEMNARLHASLAYLRDDGLSIAA